MPTYIALTCFTDQGIRKVKDTVKRADQVKEVAAKLGVKMKDLHWTVGQYDVIVTFEAPDDATMTAVALAIGEQGFVRTQTLRAFSKDEMTKILAKVA